MHEFDLHTIWNADAKEQDSFYDQKRNQVIALAQEKSQDSLRKVERNTKSELLFSSILLIVIIVLLHQINPILLGVIILFSLTNLFLTYRFYSFYQANIDAAFSSDIQTSIYTYLKILKRYRSHLRRYLLTVIPFCLLLGYVAGFQLGEGSFQDLLEPYIFRLSIVILGLCLPLAYGVLNYYLKWLLGNQIAELEEIKRGLRD